ncbi:MAG: hypothetical protein ACXAC7_18925 [Candidatus Hodarchaeales archaeon]|jgi:hypothetical protein
MPRIPAKAVREASEQADGDPTAIFVLLIIIGIFYGVYFLIKYWDEISNHFDPKTSQSQSTQNVNPKRSNFICNNCGNTFNAMSYTRCPKCGIPR